MSYSRNSLLTIRNCWKVWNKLCHASPTKQVSSDVWARLKALDLLAPKEEGEKGLNLLKNGRNINIVAARRCFRAPNSRLFGRSNPGNLITISPNVTLNKNSRSHRRTQVIQCHTTSGQAASRSATRCFQVNNNFQKSKICVAHLNLQSIKERSHPLQVRNLMSDNEYGI